MHKISDTTLFIRFGLSFQLKTRYLGYLCNRNSSNFYPKSKGCIGIRLLYRWHFPLFASSLQASRFPSYPFTGFKIDCSVTWSLVLSAPHYASRILFCFSPLSCRLIFEISSTHLCLSRCSKFITSSKGQ